MLMVLRLLHLLLLLPAKVRVGVIVIVIWHISSLILLFMTIVAIIGPKIIIRISIKGRVAIHRSFELFVNYEGTDKLAD